MFCSWDGDNDGIDDAMMITTMTIMTTMIITMMVMIMMETGVDRRKEMARGK